MNFQSAVLSRLLPTLLTAAAALPAFGKTHEIKVDLKGDGNAQTVSVRWNAPENPKDNTLTVRAGGQEISLPCDVFFDQEAVVKAVKLTEKSPALALVRLAGPSDHAENLLFSLRDGRLIHAGTLTGEVAFPGNGSITETGWMGFWQRKRKFAPDAASGLLKEIPQEFYAVNVTGTVKESFPVLRSRNGKEEVAKTRAGSKFTVLAAEPVPDKITDAAYEKIHYLVQTETGWLGWVTQKTLQEKAELPWAG